MKKRETLSKGEELLTRVLEECLEEDLSFVPPEREIARTHRFSEAFEGKMNALLEEVSRTNRDQEIRKHFHPRYGELAACVLIFLVCGYLFYSVMGPMLDTGAEAPAAGTTAAEAFMEDAMAEETAEAEESAPAAEKEDLQAAVQEAGASVPGQKVYCGQTVYLAEQQEVPELLEHVTTLVNCPVLDAEEPILYLTIGNTGDRTIRYLDRYELQVWLEDGWYVIPDGAAGTGTWTELEAGMAVDEEIDLNDYQMDYLSEKYRLIAHVNQDMVSAEFTFEEPFTEQMEKLEEEEASGE